MNKNNTNDIRSTLGVVAISYNEEENLPGFLDNLLPWVDEIVIIDDGSTDSTPKMAAKAGDKVQFIVDPRKENEGFNHQRNKGINKATADWLLHMDIDERVPPELAEEILEAIKSPDKDGYYYRRLNFFLNRPMRGGGWQLWNGLHLARRDKFRFQTEKGPTFHEQVILDAPENRIGQLKNKMWHLDDHNYANRLRKNIIYSTLEADRIVSNGKKIQWYHFLLIPLWRAIKVYFYHRGYRDGVPGLILGLYTFSGTLSWYAMAWEKQNPLPRKDLEIELSNLWRIKDTSGQ